MNECCELCRMNSTLISSLRFISFVSYCVDSGIAKTYYQYCCSGYILWRYGGGDICGLQLLKWLKSFNVVNCWNVSVVCEIKQVDFQQQTFFLISRKLKLNNWCYCDKFDDFVFHLESYDGWYFLLKFSIAPKLSKKNLEQHWKADWFSCSLLQFLLIWLLVHTLHVLDMARHHI